MGPSKEGRQHHPALGTGIRFTLSFKCSRGPIQIIRPNRAMVKEQIEMSKFSVQSLVALKGMKLMDKES